MGTNSNLLPPISIACESETSEDQNVINLSGNWKFQVDSLDVGVNQQWFSKKLEDTINLPSSMTTNGLVNARHAI